MSVLIVVDRSSCGLEDELTLGGVGFSLRIRIAMTRDTREAFQQADGDTDMGAAGLANLIKGGIHNPCKSRQFHDEPRLTFFFTDDGRAYGPARQEAQGKT